VSESWWEGRGGEREERGAREGVGEWRRRRKEK
jgi:hypothetical protein